MRAACTISVTSSNPDVRAGNAPMGLEAPANEAKYRSTIYSVVFLFDTQMRGNMTRRCSRYFIR